MGVSREWIQIKNVKIIIPSQFHIFIGLKAKKNKSFQHHHGSLPSNRNFRIFATLPCASHKHDRTNKRRPHCCWRRYRHVLFCLQCWLRQLHAWVRIDCCSGRPLGRTSRRGLFVHSRCLHGGLYRWWIGYCCCSNSLDVAVEMD